MRLLGNLTLVGLGSIQNLRAENLAEDPVSPIVGQIWYNSTDGVYRGFDGTTVITFPSAADLGTMQTEINAIETGAGLGTDGTYSANATSTYLSAATSLFDADQKLDVALKALADDVAAIGEGNITGLQSEIDAIETGAGLAADGTYSANTGAVYISAATSLANADNLLDAAINTVAGTASSAASAAITAQNTADAALPTAGGTMSGNIAMGNNKVTGLASPTAPNDAVNKAYADALKAGLDFQADVNGVQTDNTLAPSLVAGARYILTDVLNLDAGFGTIAGVANNDIVEYDGSEFVVVYDVSAAGEGALTWNRGSSAFYFYDGTVWSAFGGLSGVEAGIGLGKVGNVLNVNVGAGIVIDGSDAVSVSLAAAGGLAFDGSEDLIVKFDGGTLSASASGVKVADAGIGATQISSAALGDGLQGGSGQALSVKLATGSNLTLDSNGLAFNAAVLDSYLAKSGGTLTGDLTLAGDPTAALHAATKQYTDAADAALSTRIANSTYSYDGSVSAATHTVTHNLGTKYCNVTVIDSNDKVIIPDSITFTSNNALEVAFASAITCRVVCTGTYTAP